MILAMVENQSRRNPATDENGYPARPPPSNNDRCMYYDKPHLLQQLERLSPWALRVFFRTWDPSTYGFFKCSVVGSDLQVTAMRIGNIWETDDHVEPLVVVDKGAYYGEAPDLVPYTDKGQPRRAKIQADGFWASGPLESFNKSNKGVRDNARLSDPAIVALIQFMFLVGNKRLFFYYEKPGASKPSEQHLGTLRHALEVVTYNYRQPEVIKLNPQPPLPSSNSANTQAEPVLPAQQMHAQHTAQQQQTLPTSQTTKHRHILPSTGARPFPPFYPPLPAAPYRAPHPVHYPAAMAPQLPTQQGFYYRTAFHQEEMQFPQVNPYPQVPVQPHTQAPARPYMPVPSYPYPRAQTSRKGKEPMNPHTQAPMNPYAQTNPFAQAPLDPALMAESAGLTRPGGSALNMFDPNNASANGNGDGFFGSHDFNPNSVNAHGNGVDFFGSNNFNPIEPPPQDFSFLPVPDVGGQSSNNAFDYSAVDGSFPAGDEGLDIVDGLPPGLTDASTLGTSDGSTSLAGNGTSSDLSQGSTTPAEGGGPETPAQSGSASGSGSASE